jgi:selenide,water dikinase
MPQHMADILFDPQTSGGLLMAVSKTKAARLLRALHDGGVPAAAVIGEVVASPAGRISVK